MLPESASCASCAPPWSSNSAPTCARVPTRNSVKYRETNPRTALNLPLTAEAVPEFTLVLDTVKKIQNYLSFFFFLSLLFPIILLICVYLDDHTRKSITKGIHVRKLLLHLLTSTFLPGFCGSPAYTLFPQAQSLSLFSLYRTWPKCSRQSAHQIRSIRSTQNEVEYKL